MKLKSLWKTISPVINLVMGIGLVIFSIGGIIYMFVIDAYSFWLLATFCVYLFSSVRGLIGDLFKSNE
ncbi:hypothetical protein EEX84_01975 [Planococcus salinus]|uniref:Uncharacterized protein n=1 Tax=Planococcus salinus TaxID=1848460 RepID=A0A3M8PE53_9BACL|nr:hypothetical protein EEX84_01975 [Planococcus salinus]